MSEHARVFGRIQPFEASSGGRLLPPKQLHLSRLGSRCSNDWGYGAAGVAGSGRDCAVHDAQGTSVRTQQSKGGASLSLASAYIPQ